MFSVLCSDEEEMLRVESQVSTHGVGMFLNIVFICQLKIIARAVYSNPPMHGARIVGTILADPALQAQWRGEIQTMAGRIIAMRTLLKEKLYEAGSKRNWDHITNQIGMFSYTGLTAPQCDELINKHHIYLTRNGRISMAGVTTKNVSRLAEGIALVTRN
jgi:aspartate aminotransferase